MTDLYRLHFKTLGGTVEKKIRIINTIGLKLYKSSFSYHFAPNEAGINVLGLDVHLETYDGAQVNLVLLVSENARTFLEQAAELLPEFRKAAAEEAINATMVRPRGGSDSNPKIEKEMR